MSRKTDREVAVCSCNRKLCSRENEQVALQALMSRNLGKRGRKEGREGRREEEKKGKTSFRRI